MTVWESWGFYVLALRELAPRCEAFIGVHMGQDVRGSLSYAIMRVVEKSR
jgi:hypothetical protein